MPFRVSAHTSAAALALVALPAAAQSGTQHVDVQLYDDNGKVEVGFYDFDTATFVPGVRLFSETLESITPSFYFVSAPGFYSDSTNPLPPNAFITTNAPAVDHPFNSSYANATYTVDAHNFLYWDGEDDDNDGDYLDDVAFSTPPTGTTVDIRFSSQVALTLDGSATTPFPGLFIEQANGAGGIHTHVAFEARGANNAYMPDGHLIVPLVFSAINGSGDKVIEDSEVVFLHFSADYDRDVNGNFQFIPGTPIPLTEAAADDAAQQWVEDYFLRELGDFNDSEALDADDIDQLFAQEDLADPAFGFDLTGDALVTTADLDRWVYDLAGTRYGDANLDRSVNIVDLGLLASSFGGAGGWADGDFNGDGQVNIVDLGILAAEFGFSAAVTADLLAALDAGDLDAAQAIYAANVPEPATAALLALGAAAAITRRGSAMAG